MNKKHYAQRDFENLEPHFTNHIFAMTAENLHGKASIAGELAFRDAAIAALVENYITILEKYNILEKENKELKGLIRISQGN